MEQKIISELAKCRLQNLAYEVRLRLLPAIKVSVRWVANTNQSKGWLGFIELDNVPGFSQTWKTSTGFSEVDLEDTDACLDVYLKELEDTKPVLGLTVRPEYIKPNYTGIMR